MHRVTLAGPDDFEGWRDAARALALGFAPAPVRAGWDALRSKALREAAVRAWGEARLALAESRWIGC